MLAHGLGQEPRFVPILLCARVGQPLERSRGRRTKIRYEHRLPNHKEPEPLALAKPDHIELVWIDPQTGLRGSMGCAGALELPFVQGSAPEGRAPCSGGLDAAAEAVDATVQSAKNWLERLLGK